MQRDQQRGNLRIGRGTREDLVHDLTRRLTRERRAVVRDLMQRFNDHC